MKNLTVCHKLLTVVLFAMTVTGCSKKGVNPNSDQNVNSSSELKITSISVDSGPAGKSIAIFGSDFTTKPNNVEPNVFFNGSQAEVQAQTLTRLDVIVPRQAGTGDVTVEVNGQVAVGPVFKYIKSVFVLSLTQSGKYGASPGYNVFYANGQASGIFVDSVGNLFYTDIINLEFREFTSAGQWSLLAGTGNFLPSIVDGQGNVANFYSPTGLARDKSGIFYVADGQGIRKITPPLPTVTTFAGYNSSADFTSVVINTGNGTLYATDAANHVVKKINVATGVTSIFAGSGSIGSTDGQGILASFNQPTGIAIDNKGNLYVTDRAANVIRKITPGGTVSTIAGSGIHGKQDGQGTAATFNQPGPIVVDSYGNLFVADVANHVIRKVTTNGTVSTYVGNGATYLQDGTALGASFSKMLGLCIDRQTGHECTYA